jgi:hypothetical protein
MTSFTAAVSALPLDFFRVLVGILGVAYFARTGREVSDFSDPDGLIDQALQHRVLPFTRLTLLPARTPAWLLRALHVAGCVASTMLSLGIATAVVAPFLYLLAVSIYRRSFLVIGVDDGIIHLALFWMVVLPIGHTLVISDLLSGRAFHSTWDTWSTVVVSGLGVRCLLFNLALAYATAGLWKLTSPLWRSGEALRVVLAMPVSYGLGPRLAGWPARWLRIGTYFVLLAEPLGAILFALSPRSWQAWTILTLMAALHVGIIATVKVPLANIAMLASLVAFVAFAALVPDLRMSNLPMNPLSTMDWVVLGVMVCLVGQILFNTCAAAFGLGGGPRTRSDDVMNPFYVPLWIIGLAQSYRLLDWVDERNYDVEYEVLERRSGHPEAMVDAAEMFPRSMRHILLQSYLIGDLWTKLDPAALSELRASILTRYAARYVRCSDVDAEVEVHATIRRITGNGVARGTRALLMRFENRSGSASAIETHILPESR